MSVIEFPGNDKPATEVAEEPDLGITVETAAEVHRMDINGLLHEAFREHPKALGLALVAAMARQFGPDFVQDNHTRT